MFDSDARESLSDTLSAGVRRAISARSGDADAEGAFHVPRNARMLTSIRHSLASESRRAATLP
jgi:hypothetical protein